MSSFDKALETLLQGDRPRVWSLVVTIFGDLAQNQGDEISAQTLGRLTEPMGVKSEALRVALHRLRKDGWIESTRNGRSRSYFLTGFGLQQSALATPRIYGQTNPQHSKWVLLTTEVLEASKSLISDLQNDRDFVQLGANIFLTNEAHTPVSQGILVTNLDASPLPEWVKNHIIDPQLSLKYNEFYTQLAALRSDFPMDLTALERAVLRTLIVHNWRKIILRHIDIPKSFYPGTCNAWASRALVLEILDRLDRPALSDLLEA